MTNPKQSEPTPTTSPAPHAGEREVPQPDGGATGSNRATVPGEEGEADELAEIEEHVRGEGVRELSNDPPVPPPAD